jgi:hypothetical protein
MEQRPGEHLEEEPQEERGEPGSRDEGYSPGGGPADRPDEKDRFGPDDVTGVDPQEPVDEDMPYQPPGDQGG